MVDKGRQMVNEVAYNVKQEVTREVGVDPGREADKVVKDRIDPKLLCAQACPA